MISPQLTGTSVIAEETTRYFVKSVNVTDFITSGGRLHVDLIQDVGIEMEVDIIIVVNGNEFTFKFDSSLENEFFLIVPGGRKIRFSYLWSHDLPSTGEYRVGESFIFYRMNLGIIDEIMLVSKGNVEPGVSENIKKSGSRVFGVIDS